MFRKTPVMAQTPDRATPITVGLPKPKCDLWSGCVWGRETLAYPPISSGRDGHSYNFTRNLRCRFCNRENTRCVTTSPLGFAMCDAVTRYDDCEGKSQTVLTGLAR